MTQGTSTQDIVKKVFDSIISLEPGSKIPIQFSSAGQRESFRVRFHREKTKYQEKFGEVQANTINCVKHVINNKLYLIIEKTEPMSVPYIILPDGQTQELDLSDTSCEPTPPPIELPLDIPKCIPKTWPEVLCLSICTACQ